MELPKIAANSDKAPFRRVFLPSDAMAAIDAIFLDEDRCRQWVIEKLHGDAARCPACKAEILDDRRLQRFWKGDRLACPKCGKFFTATTATFISGVHLDYREIFFLAVLLAMGMSNQQIADKLGCNQETVRLWRYRFEVIKNADTEAKPHLRTDR